MRGLTENVVATVRPSGPHVLIPLEASRIARIPAPPAKLVESASALTYSEGIRSVDGPQIGMEWRNCQTPPSGVLRISYSVNG